MKAFGRWGLGLAAAILLGGLIFQRPVITGEEDCSEEPSQVTCSTVKGLLPGDGEVEGWTIVEDSLTFCPTPDSLTDIYDGGYERYVEAGVQQAVVQAYACENELVLVYVHELTSPEQAEAICRGFHDSLSGSSGALSDLEGTDGGFLYVGGGQSSGYFWKDRFYCNVVANAEGEKDQAAVKQFSSSLGKKIDSCLGGDEKAGDKESSTDESVPGETGDD